nr:immunoglobulin light chain junction region [Macaca mulatta]MOX98014.1 immunoglobulin light chain junction region [Macaca mulatta]MOX98328.1 immunoglobulin light chain junction region [Macaca mulatta]
CMQGVEYPFTF